jgi:hypothetical protein
LALLLSVRPSFCRATTGFGSNTWPVPLASLTSDSTRRTAPPSASTTVRIVPFDVSLSTFQAKAGAVPGTTTSSALYGWPPVRLAAVERAMFSGTVLNACGSAPTLIRPSVTVTAPVRRSMCRA